MDPTLIILLLLLVSPLIAQQTSHITVTGSVFCDVCYDNSFTKHSYFLPGVDVHLQCKFQTNAPKTGEQLITFSVNRTTNRYGVYRLDYIPSVEGQGVDCVDGPAIESFCEASLIGSSLPTCNVPAVSTSSKEITVKSRTTNLCVYSVSALTYTPSTRNSTLCGGHDINLEEEEETHSLDSSKFFLPYFPWPQFPPSPWPSLPPFPSFPPLPPLPHLPPLPQLPPAPPLGSLIPPSPPGFNLRDPRTWFPPSPNNQQHQQP